MSFNNYEQYQAQGGPQDPNSGISNPDAQQQEGGMNQQAPMDPGQAAFQGGNGGDPTAAGGQMSGDNKTTLW